MRETTVELSVALALGLVSASAAKADVVPLELHVSCADEQGTHTEFLSEQDILKMPTYSITTSTPWKATSRFSGIRLTDVIKKTCPSGSFVTITAYDEYEIKDIDVPSVFKDQPLLAYSMNGQRLLLKNFGPLFLVYDRDGSDSSRIKTSQYSAKEIRQIKSLSIR